jgi:hypothetical protein
MRAAFMRDLFYRAQHNLNRIALNNTVIISFVTWLQNQLNLKPSSRSADFSKIWASLMELLTAEDKRILRNFEEECSSDAAAALVHALMKYPVERLMPLLSMMIKVKGLHHESPEQTFGFDEIREYIPGAGDNMFEEPAPTVSGGGEDNYHGGSGGGHDTGETGEAGYIDEGEIEIGATVEEPVTCYFRATADEEITTKRVSVLEVTISREAFQEAAAGIFADDSAVVDPGEDIVIEVRGVNNIKVEGNTSQNTRVPAAGLPKPLYFNFRATHDGDCKIAVDAWQHQKLLLTMELSLRSVGQAIQGEKKSATGYANTVKPFQYPPVQLRIWESTIGQDCFYDYEIYAPALNAVEKFEPKKIIGDRKQYIANLYKDIEKLWKTVNYDDDAFQLRLRAFGSQLFLDLFPEKLQQFFFTKGPDITSITVMSTEPFIPWELLLVRNPDKNAGVTDADKFLCEYGLVRWLYKWVAAESLVIRNDKARYMIPSYLKRSSALKSSEQEIAMLKKLFKASEVNPDIQSVTALFDTKGSFDLLHFCCHGSAADAANNNAELLIAETKEGVEILPVTLSQAQVEMYGRMNDGPDQRPVVVINACQAGRNEEKITSFGGFAEAFLLRGAGMFIAALWNIQDNSAFVFTQELYEQMLHGKSLSDAAVLARNKTKQTEGATWLAYTVYGHPDAKLTIK